MRLSFAGLALASLLLFPCECPRSHAASTDFTQTSLLQLEDRAAHADAREQCFLYTELVQVYTDMAGKQMASGDMEQASATLKRVEGFAAHIHMGLTKDTRRLKTAEIMMHTATHRLGQYMHSISSEDKVVVASTLKQLDKVNDELLAQVFAH